MMLDGIPESISEGVVRVPAWHRTRRFRDFSLASCIHKNAAWYQIPLDDIANIVYSAKSKSCYLI